MIEDRRSRRPSLKRALITGLVCAGASVLVVALMPAGAPAAGTRAFSRAHFDRFRAHPPRAFASCARLVDYGRAYLARTHGLPETPVQPLPGSVGAPVRTTTGAAPTLGTPQSNGSSNGTGAFSTTNNQEAGVEEPDTVKTDGSTIFAVSGRRLYAVAASGGSPRLVGSLDLGPSGYGSQLLLAGTHLLVISSAPSGGPVLLGAPRSEPARPTPAYPSPYYFGGRTTIDRIDVSDPSSMKLIGTLSIDGSFVDARQNGSTARIVVSSAPRAIAQPGLRGSVAGYVPTWHYHGLINRRRMHGFVARCNEVAHPAQFSGLGMVTIFTVDIDHGLAFATADALMADAQVVYGSPSSIYLATQRWINPATPADQLPSTSSTQIDRFDASTPNATTFVASGDVPGYLLNQFSLSEFNGFLRVASTSSPDYWNHGVPQVASQSYVTVLATRGNQLVPVGQVAGLGTGQRIYSVRFVGETGYVVTFRQVDPLYTINLSDPTMPKVGGQLELEGYSSYLHPLSNGLLLGVGQDVGAGNEPSGAQLELFDVSDPNAPKLVQKTSLGQGSASQVQYDHHAFLYWAPTGLAVIPVQIYPITTGPPTPVPGPGSTTSTSSSPGPASGEQFVGAVGFHVDGTGISEVGRISHPAQSGYTPPITRSIVIGDELYTLSDSGLLASRLDTLAPDSFVTFPHSPSPPIAFGTGSATPGATRSSPTR